MVSDGLWASVMTQTEYPLDLVDGMLATDTFHHDMELTRFGEQLKDQIISSNYSPL